MNLTLEQLQYIGKTLGVRLQFDPRKKRYTYSQGEERRALAVTVGDEKTAWMAIFGFLNERGCVGCNKRKQAATNLAKRTTNKNSLRLSPSTVKDILVDADCGGCGFKLGN